MPMRDFYGGPRVLLRRLREVMAEPIRPQERLDKIVVLIAANMVAEVCSLYVLRADGVLELFATEGLKREAVHQTTMRPGEGLVGLIAKEAKPLALSDAQSHPAFSYKPETGEEIFQSFLGVPVLRAGNTLGVLVLQNRAQRSYSEEEIEALQTTSMVLAEMLATGELQTLVRAGISIALKKPVHLVGQGLSDAIGLGYAVLYEPRIVVHNLIAEDTSVELARLDEALDAMRSSIDKLIAGDDLARVSDHREIFEAFSMFAEDRGWANRMREAILNGLTAEAAVERVQSDTRARMLRVSDPYLRERLHDLDDLASRLMRQLVGDPLKAVIEAMPKDAIIVARQMGPAALLEFDRKRLRGLVIEEGGITSHVAIVARALGIAAVSQAENITSLVEMGDAIIVDGIAGDVYLRPAPDVEHAYAERVRFRARRQAHYEQLRSKPSVSRDGVAVDLLLNAGLLVDLPHLHESGASGIGLFRTELQFMVADRFPRMLQQQELYSAVFEATQGRPVTFRTLDIGGDKHLPYMPAADESNPALGWRAVRMGLDRPGLLRTQLRALLKAAAGRPLRIMVPMVSVPDEIDQVRAMLERERLHFEHHNHPWPEKLEVGTMLEVPSLLFCLDEICQRVDFISVGSNDLAQFFFAVDRDNLRVSGRFDVLSRSFLRALQCIVIAAEKHAVDLTLCGEMASKPLEALALIALGFRKLSMSPAAIGPIKAMLLKLDVACFEAFVTSALECSNGPISLRAQLLAYAEQQQVVL